MYPGKRAVQIEVGSPFLVSFVSDVSVAELSQPTPPDITKSSSCQTPRSSSLHWSGRATCNPAPASIAYNRCHVSRLSIPSPQSPVCDSLADWPGQICFTSFHWPLVDIPGERDGQPRCRGIFQLSKALEPVGRAHPVFWLQKHDKAQNPGSPSLSRTDSSCRDVVSLPSETVQASSASALACPTLPQVCPFPFLHPSPDQAARKETAIECPKRPRPHDRTCCRPRCRKESSCLSKSSHRPRSRRSCRRPWPWRRRRRICSPWAPWSQQIRVLEPGEHQS